jgi:hypothetical protein
MAVQVLKTYAIFIMKSIYFDTNRKFSSNVSTFFNPEWPGIERV